MGKLKKLKRLEKAKVKLKKKTLPKGQNETDIRFKAKKIVIPQQLKPVNENELHTRKKLNVKELLTHLKHHNSSIRQQGIEGLKELMTFYTDDVVRLHLPELIEGVCQLVLDLENDVRKDSLKLLDSVLSQISSEQIVPLFDILLSYMACAMTHIKPVVQGDALLLMDSLLRACPTLLARQEKKVFPLFLDMISNLKSDSGLDRTLSMNVNSKITSVKWRIQVLSRLKRFFDSLVLERKNKGYQGMQETDQCKQDGKTLVWKHNEPLYASIFINYSNEKHPLPSSYRHSLHVTTESEERETLKKYVESLMPLLLETWIEVSPEENGRNEHILKEEGALLLGCVLGIMQRVWEYLDSWDQDARLDTLTKWFKNQYEKDVIHNLMFGFPYALNEAVTSDVRKRKRSSQTKKNIQLLSDSSTLSSTCAHQNLALCYLVICVHDGNRKDVVDKVTSYIKKISSNEIEDSAIPIYDAVLRNLLLEHSESWTNSIQVLRHIVQCQQQITNSRLKNTLFNVLCDVILKPDLYQQFNFPEFDKWVSQLPNILCQPKVPLKAVETLSQLACQNNKVLLANLQGKVENIIGCMMQMTVVGAVSPLQGKKVIVDILYRLGELDESVLDKLINHINGSSNEQELSSYVQNLKLLRQTLLM